VNALTRLLFIICMAGAAEAAPIANITFTPFPLGDPPVYTVTALAADPSGSKVWFTDQNFVQIGFIDLATGAATRYSVRPPGGESALVIASIQALVFGSDGNLWFPAVFGLTTGPTSMMGRFHPATGTVTYFAIAGSPFLTDTRLARGPDGNVWFTYQSEPRLGTITPSGVAGSINVATAGGAVPGIMKGLAFGADGNAWVTAGFRSIYRVPLSGGAATEFRLQGGSFRSPAGITRGPDDSLYFVQSGTSADMGNRIGRITTAGVITEWVIPTADSAPTGIAAGSDGKIYFTEQLAKQLGQLDPLTGSISESPVPNGELPIAIVAVPAGGSSPTRVPGAGVHATAKTGIVFNALPSNLRDGRAIYAVIDPGDLQPDPEAAVFLVDNPLFGGSDPEVYERFRIGGAFFLLLRAENVAETAPTFGPIEMKTRLPDFVTGATGGFIGAPGACREEDRVLTCTTTKVLLPDEAVTALVTFEVPRPPKGEETFTFTIYNSISGGSDVNPNNNFAGYPVVFLVDRAAGVLTLLPALEGLAVLGGRR
jgi:streptogramin lyase